MDYKLVCIDMDGTLLDSKFTVPDENVKALKEAIKQGVQIALVTGRPYNIASYFRGIIGDAVHIIGTNGTYFKFGDYEYKKSLSDEEIELVYKVADQYNLTAHFKGHNVLISNKKLEDSQPEKLLNETLPAENQMLLYDDCSLEDVQKYHQNNISKCIVFSDDLDAVAKGKEAIKQYDKMEVVSSHENNFETMPVGTSKGLAVKSLCEMLKVRPEELICIGDNENDLSMIKFAGLGIAMGNAPQYIKEQADYVTDTNLNCGVAKAIRKFILDK